MGSNQLAAQQCYSTSTKTPMETLGASTPKPVVRSVKSVAMREDPDRASPHEDMELIEFAPGQPSKTFKIGTKLDKKHRLALIRLIREYEEVFAWSPEDMPGVDPAVATHKLHINPNYHPVRQKKRNFNDEKKFSHKKGSGEATPG